MKASRRSVLAGSMAVAGSWLLAACSANSPSNSVSQAFATPSALTPSPGQHVVTRTITASAFTADLGGVNVNTWGYGNTLPGPELRASAGDLLRITLDNQLPAPTTIHWHGIQIRNAADGVPGLTQDAVTQGTKFLYEFVAPDPGTYFFHSHQGVQLDRGLYAPLIIDDPAEPGGYDQEWVVTLDDWVDGTGRTPDQVFADLKSSGGDDSSSSSSQGMGGMGGMGGMHGSGMGGMNGSSGSMMGDSPFGSVGDVAYPHYLINGAIPAAPRTFSAKPGQRVRIRLINAASDTLFKVALGGHTMSITHTDGYPVQPHDTRALYIGMGERYDVLVTLADGVFPLVAQPFGKQGQALALVRTGAGDAPSADVHPTELDADATQAGELTPTDAARLPAHDVDAHADVKLAGTMSPYVWTINGDVFGKNTPIGVSEGQRVQLDVTNSSMMSHPLHLHGHTFALPNGVRKDTVVVPPMTSTSLQLQASNPGAWAMHCHNIYHAEAGMMIALNYR